MFLKIGVLKNYTNFTWKPERDSTKFSYEICEFFRNTFFFRTPPMAVSASFSDKKAQSLHNEMSPNILLLEDKTPTYIIIQNHQVPFKLNLGN